MFKSAIIASVCAIGVSATYADIDMGLSASVDSHKKRYYGPPPGPRLVVVDQGPEYYPPPPPPREPTPEPQRVVRRVVRQGPPRVIRG